MRDEILLFVYGTLKRFKSANGLMLRSNGVYLHDFITKPEFTMYDLSFPAVVRGGNTAIKGEVWRVPLDYIEVLDSYEGVPRLFKRETLQDDIQFYMFARPLNDTYRIIDSGEF